MCFGYSLLPEFRFGLDPFGVWTIVAVVERFADFVGQSTQGCFAGNAGFEGFQRKVGPFCQLFSATLNLCLLGAFPTKEGIELGSLFLPRGILNCLRQGPSYHYFVPPTQGLMRI